MKKYKEENCIAVAIHMAVNSIAKISPLYKVYVNVTFGKHFLQYKNYCKKLLIINL
jgi:hypothetical protein